MFNPQEMLESARTARDVAKAEFEKLERIVAALEAAVGPESRTVRAVRSTGTARGPLDGATVSAAAEFVLKEAGGPMLVADMASRLHELGYRTDLSARKLRVNLVSVMVRKTTRFKKVGVAKYGLVPERG